MASRSIEGRREGKEGWKKGVREGRTALFRCKYRTK